MISWSTGFFETQGPHDPQNLDLDSWHKVHQTNLDGMVLGCKYAISLMIKSKAASIVNISSRSGIVSIPGVAADVPLQTMGEPDDISYAAVFLASDESKYITGIELNIGGGILVGSSAVPKR